MSWDMFVAVFFRNSNGDASWYVCGCVLFSLPKEDSPRYYFGSLISELQLLHGTHVSKLATPVGYNPGDFHGIFVGASRPLK